jgi:hypothetical protein
MSSSAAPYLHPIAGLAATVLAAYAATLGLRSRRIGPKAEAARRRHASLGPWLYALFVLNWLGGLATVRWVRADIEAAASGHFAVGSAILVLLTAAVLVSTRIRVDVRARAVHPLLGAAALLLTAFQVFLGLQLLP